MRRWDAADFVGVCIGLALLAIGVGLAFMAFRYTLHPERFRDVHYDTVKTVYVWAKPAK